MTRLRFIVAAAPLTFLVAPLAIAAPPAVPAVAASLSMTLTYDFVGSAITTDPSGRSREQVMMRGHAAAQGDKVRIDIDDAGSVSGSMRGAYLLLLENGHQMVWVNPDQRRYYETQSMSMASGLGALVSGANGMIKMEASNVHIDTQQMGPGPVIQGHNTVHLRRTESMDMKTKVWSRTVNTHDESTTDYYYAPDLQNFVNPFLTNSSDEMGAILLFNETYMNQLRAANAKLQQGSQGSAPLKTVTSSKTTDEFGNTLTTVTTIAVSNLKWLDVPTSLFDIPLGYTKVVPQQTPLSSSSSSSATLVSPHVTPAGGSTNSAASTLPSTASPSAPKGDGKAGSKVDSKADLSKKTPINYFGYPQ